MLQTLACQKNKVNGKKKVVPWWINKFSTAVTERNKIFKTLQKKCTIENLKEQKLVKLLRIKKKHGRILFIYRF